MRLPLGTQDVRAYLLMLFIENSALAQGQKDALRHSVCKQLGETWQGKRVDHAFVTSLLKETPADLDRQLALARPPSARHDHGAPDRGQPEADQAVPQHSVDSLGDGALARRERGRGSALAKMLLFERCGTADGYARLVRGVNESEDGKPIFLKPWEEAVSKGQEPELPAEWNSTFNKSWLGLAPLFSGLDLRPVVYVSREHMPIITAADQLSSNAADLLGGLLEVRTSVASQLVPKLKQCDRAELDIMMERLLVRAKQAPEWGTPPVLYACLTLIDAEPDLSRSLAAFLRELPVQQLRASIVPLLRDKSWAAGVLAHWKGLVEHRQDGQACNRCRRWGEEVADGHLDLQRRFAGRGATDSALGAACAACGSSRWAARRPATGPGTAESKSAAEVGSGASPQILRCPIEPRSVRKERLAGRAALRPQALHQQRALGGSQRAAARMAGTSRTAGRLYNVLEALSRGEALPPELGIDAAAQLAGMPRRLAMRSPKRSGLRMARSMPRRAEMPSRKRFRISWIRFPAWISMPLRLNKSNSWSNGMSPTTSDPSH